MKWLIFILLIPTAKADALLDAIYGNWNKTEIYENLDNLDQEIPDDYEVEVYHWELGTPDNLPETIIIYEDSPCSL